ncbi:uncharacterized protein MELLADRAFT_107762 [Melampsora larici-populina 98AG31]|uniref:Uncharacterized protein n=1 Tax=Melampsora larici-populina (strain 98AG31 / pathotype 3-4-7) TaxID=747676 RepID=F4RQV4_MELLP|nr:uncharacterized protein MELLADRAFT_107762 [Melampsora larici-populina 98AG31]EGG05260.1 hypothetical protein MELLADRAFT_107762 [Melampsora larici-populina 98AG31]
MSLTSTTESDSLKDRLISSNKEAQCIFDIDDPRDRRSQCEDIFNIYVLELLKCRLNFSHLSVILDLDDLVEEFQSKKCSKEELEELKSLCYQRLQLLIGIDDDDDDDHEESLDLAIEHFQGILGHRQLIKDNTRAINFSFDTNTEQEAPSRKEKTKQLLKSVEDLFQAVNPQSITDFRWEVAMFVCGRIFDIDLFDPKGLYSIPLKNCLRIVSTFTNLVTFQYNSRDSHSTFEEVVSQTVASLPNLEVLVIAREENNVRRWFENYEPDLAYEEEISKLMGDSLNLLTKLKRLHLQGLIAPRSGWGKLDWKCPVEYLKVTECPRLHGPSIFTLAQAFRKTLLGLLIGPNIDLVPEIDQPNMEFGKEFEVLEELSVRVDLGRRGEEQKLVDSMSQAPKLKHFDIHRTHTDLLSRVKEQLEQPEPAWPSLRTLGLDHGVGKIKLNLGLLDKKLKDVKEYVSHKFGVLDAEWAWPTRYDHTDRYGYGKMTLSNGRVVEVKALDLDFGERTSLQYRDTAKLISQLSP